MCLCFCNIKLAFHYNLLCINVSLIVCRWEWLTYRSLFHWVTDGFSSPFSFSVRFKRSCRLLAYPWWSHRHATQSTRLTNTSIGEHAKTGSSGWYPFYAQINKTFAKFWNKRCIFDRNNLYAFFLIYMNLQANLSGKSVAVNPLVWQLWLGSVGWTNTTMLTRDNMP